ncbi:MAG TPA: prolyl oligopeptidase family serine peptidase [Candidatus Dormibacteraeota bacterium]|nr:prolyl oligopeptidase family serine peptidase [Candidatus Dormibacteraeota bacterium]
MTARTVAPYGSWASPITPELLLRGTVQLRNQMLRWDGEDLYWSELRPDEGGRIVVCRRAAGGVTADVTPPGFNARSRVHEYGGGHFAVSRGTVWFTNFEDQRLYRQEGGRDPQPITPDADVRHADMAVDARRDLIFAVREDHTTGAVEPVNTLVALPAAGGEAHTIAAGGDFYSSPRLSPDGSRLAWTTWNHPNMPWDGTELWIGELDAHGRIKSSRKIAGGEGESILQPEWSPLGELYFVSDRTDWWNLYRARGEGDEPVCRYAAEFGAPHWVFGQRFYDFAGPDEIVSLYTVASGTRLGRLDLNTGTLNHVQLLYSGLHGVQVHGRKAAFYAGSSTLAERVLVIDLDTQAEDVVRVANPAHIDAGYLSTPRPVEFQTENGLTAHAFYYAPRNKDFDAPPDEKPPLVVHCHGGPTGSAGQIYPFEYQYWTSRGIALVDVNYGGSAGYGRAYRQRLNRQWGVVDVDDCINAARHLVNEGLADSERVSITGGSAGGYTTLLSLTKRDFYNAGASHYGIGDLELFIKETHKFESHYCETLVGRYPERADVYHDRSAIYFADSLRCPVILFQGLEDRVVPPSQAETFVAVCKKNGLPYAYIPFEGEQHGFRQDRNIKRSIEGELYFLARIFEFQPADQIEPVEMANFRGEPPG